MENNALPEFERANVGDFVKFGRYPQESGNEPQPVEWQVLSKENGQMLVISRYGLDSRRFDGSSNNWGNSKIRKWLNGEFYNGSFAYDEKALIKSFNRDNVFLLSREEAEKYFANRGARICKPTSYAKAKGAWIWKDGCGYWWLRSPSPSGSDNVFSVRRDGDVRSNGVLDDDVSVRPALWIKVDGVEQDCKEAKGPAALGNAEAKEKMERNGNPFRNAKIGD